jgi:hypothetical protein
LLSLVLVIKEKVGYTSGSWVTDGFDIFDDGRAVWGSIMKAIMRLAEETNLSTLFPEPAMEAGVC